MKRRNNITQNSPEWHQLRKGKITGTVLKDIMGSSAKRESAKWEIIAQRLTVGVETEYENPMERGHRLEPEAIAAFEFETGKPVERTGFCEDDADSFIAQSPDGLIGETEAVEIKCMGGKNHIKAWFTNEVPDEYYWQVVQYFVVNPKLETLYFTCYNPDIPVHSLHIIEVKRDSLTEPIKAARLVQEGFIAEVNSELSKIIKL